MLVYVIPNLLRASSECMLGAYFACLQALREFGAIVKNKQYPQAGRLRANMGNIYYEQVPIVSLIYIGRLSTAAIFSWPT